MKRFTSETQKVGELGEDIASKFLVKQGFTIIERNYTITTGEIDIIASKAGELVFWEVKTSQCSMGNKVSRETFNPFDNIHQKKIRRITQTVEQYLYTHNVSHETKFFVHGIAVYLDIAAKIAKVKILENIA